MADQITNGQSDDEGTCDPYGRPVAPFTLQLQDEEELSTDWTKFTYPQKLRRLVDYELYKETSGEQISFLSWLKLTSSSGPRPDTDSIQINPDQARRLFDLLAVGNNGKIELQNNCLEVCFTEWP